MPKTIQRYLGTLTALGQVVSLSIPIESETVALRFYESESTPQIGIVALVPLLPLPLATYTRSFQLIPDGAVLPPTFKKYVATFPFGPQKELAHIVEV
jgi:hypothetical protein